MRGDEDHATIAAQHDVAGHDRSLADTSGLIDAYRRGIQLSVRVVQVMRRMVAAEEGCERADLLQALDVPYGAIVYDPVAGLGVDGVPQVIADGRAILVGVELVHYRY